jgi:hypothetical protein
MDNSSNPIWSPLRSGSLALVLACLSAGCGSSTPSDGPGGSAGTGSSAGGGTAASAGTGAVGAGASSTGGGSPTGPIGNPPSTTPTIPVPDGGKDAAEAETTLPLGDAPALGKVKYIPNRSSVRLYLPGVEGARDYRVFAVEDGVKVSVTDDREHVEGGTLHCAGLRQRNQCSNDAILPIKYNNEAFDMPVCERGNHDRRPNVPTQLMQTMDVVGVKPDTVLVVEAIDRLCPFPGLFGSKHVDAVIDSGDVGPKMVSAVVNDKPYTLLRWTDHFPMRTEAEIRAQYGSMILNGEGPNMPTLDPASPNFPESPWIRVAQPAPAEDPVVLARAVVKVSPSGTAKPIEGFTADDYFDDFEDSADQPKLVRESDPSHDFSGLAIKIYQTAKWNLYDVSNAFSDFMIDRGQLVMTHGDTNQGSMTTQAMYPKRAVQLPTEADQYLRVTYEVQRIEGGRRYENFSLCGSDKPGETYVGDAPKTGPLPRPGFMNEAETTHTNIYGWNCLFLVPRGAGYGVVPGGDIKSHSDTSLKITVVGTSPPPTQTSFDKEHLTQYAAAFGPYLETDNPLWERQVDASMQPSGMWLDDQMNVWQKTRFDVFVRRDRVVIYVEGQQRICQEMKEKPLTMAEGALGFWHVLYHSSAEFSEIRQEGDSDNPKTGMHHLMHNTPFADERSYDNVGFKENVTLPENFDPARCYSGSNLSKK